MKFPFINILNVSGIQFENSVSKDLQVENWSVLLVF